MSSDTKPSSSAISYDQILDDATWLIGTIAQITGRPRDEVARRMADENRRMGTSVSRALAEHRIAPFVWSDALARFYAETDAFLFESLVWNRTPEKRTLRRWISQRLARSVSREDRRILVYGDGLGFDSAFFALAGSQVDYFEVSGMGERFARKLFERCGIDVRVVTSADSLTPDSYDAVLCLDVLEHVPAPERLAEELCALVCDQGLLFVSAPYWFLDRSVATHLAMNRRFCGDWRTLYGRHGMKPVAARPFWNPLALQRVSQFDPQSSPTRRSPDDDSRIRGAGSWLDRLVVLGGGSLLTAARWFNSPLILAARSMNWLQRRRWPELELELSR